MGCLWSLSGTLCATLARYRLRAVGIEPVTLRTADGLDLEAELRVPEAPWGAAVLAHPHPEHGGNMRSIVPGALFEALPAAGVGALRFNFRGVGRSQGSFEGGVGERHDVVAAIDAIASITEGLPLVLAGWSFGADTVLAVGDERAAGWLAVGRRCGGIATTWWPRPTRAPR